MRLHAFSFFFLFAFTVTLIRACPDEKFYDNSKRDNSFFTAVQSIWKRCPDHDNLMKRIAINLNERDQFDKEKIGKHVTVARDLFSSKHRNHDSYDGDNLYKRSLSYFVRRHVDKTFWPAIKNNKSKKRQKGAANKSKKSTSHDAGAPFPLKRSPCNNNDKNENLKRKTPPPSPSNKGGANSNGNNFDSINIKHQEDRAPPEVPSGNTPIAKRQSRMPPEVPIIGPIHPHSNKRDVSKELRSKVKKRVSTPTPPPVPPIHPNHPKRRANKAPPPEIPILPPIIDRNLPIDAIKRNSEPVPPPVIPINTKRDSQPAPPPVIPINTKKRLATRSPSSDSS